MTSLGERLGVRITQGPMDWQIIQRRLDNVADIPLAGTYKVGEGVSGVVEVRVTCANAGCALTPELDWRPVDFQDSENWSSQLSSVPAGGPYRIESRLRKSDGGFHTGDRLHQIGVGDLWVIAGQSNAVGCGHGAVEDMPSPDVHLFRACEEWGMADHPLHDPTRSRHPANRDAGWNDHSPWLTFGRLLTKRLGIPIGLIPAALGGSGLDQWDPGEDNPPLYPNMLAFIRAASAMTDHARFDETDGGPVFLPSDHGEIGRIAGVLWYQGCSDVGEKFAGAYYDRFVRFVEGVRAAVDSPGLPFITVQINRCVGAFDANEGWSLVREAQRQAARQLPFVAVVPTLDLDLSDGIHISPRGNLVIGQRAAQAALGMVYGHDVTWKAPDIAGASCEDGDRKRVMLYIENVINELWSCGMPVKQFTVVDENGDVEIAAAEMVQPDRIRLLLAREIAGNARVHNGYGCYPPVAVFDREHRPLLGWTGVPIE